MERVTITKSFHGICHMQVCAVPDVTDEEILEKCNMDNPSGTTLGWTRVVRNDLEHPQMNPVRCGQYLDRIHFLVAC